MNNASIIPVDEEIKFADDEIIVSKTDLKGEIKYANEVFCRLAEMDENDVIGKPHNVIRHPDMPRSIFYFLWEAIKAKKEIFAYVKNMSSTGKYYWVYAHVTPTVNEAGQITGYHSSRRSVEPAKLSIVSDLYKKLLSLEEGHSNRKEGMTAAIEYFNNFLKQQNKTYDDYIWSIGE